MSPPRKIYDTYNFTDVDPAMDAIRTAQNASGMSWNEMSDVSGVSRSTFYCWKKRKTRLPRFSTMAASALALGYDTIQLSKGKVVFVKAKPVAQIIPMRKRG